MERRQPLEGIIMFPRSIRIVRALALFLSILAFAASGADAPAPDDKDALAGMKEVKVAFDIHEGDGKGLLNRLNVIDETRQSLIKQGVTPHFVIAIRGPATRLVQTDVEKIKPEDRPVAVQIAAKLHEMSTAPGIQSVEQCSVAIRQQGTKAENVLPELKVIGNSWISLMAYQAKGYAYISP
jgi:intracellular sulfur oxidation DsrE/DsrF family protein